MARLISRRVRRGTGRIESWPLGRKTGRVKSRTGGWGRRMVVVAVMSVVAVVSVMSVVAVVVVVAVVAVVVVVAVVAVGCVAVVVVQLDE